jgi:hypothetical protein
LQESGLWRLPRCRNRLQCQAEQESPPVPIESIPPPSPRPEPRASAIGAARTLDALGYRKPNHATSAATEISASITTPHNIQRTQARAYSLTYSSSTNNSSTESPVGDSRRVDFSDCSIETTLFVTLQPLFRHGTRPGEGCIGRKVRNNAWTDDPRQCNLDPLGKFLPTYSAPACPESSSRWAQLK